MTRPTVFLSYCHQDEAWKDRISGHLRVLGDLEVWDDRQIGAGENWFPAITGAMDRARVAILVISNAFLTSRFILGEEIPRLLKSRETSGLTVIPVIARPCAWQAVDWLARMQCYPKDGRALSKVRKAQVDEDLAALTLKVKELLGQRPSSVVSDKNLPSGKRFHVFLSHNRADKPAVESLAKKLLAEGIEPFLDKWHLVPSEPWQEGLENALDQSETCAVFLGPHGPGTWENEEMRVALDRRARSRMFRVIPVLLPGTSMPDRADLPAFLSRLTWVDFRLSLEDPKALRRLVYGIRGEEPGPPSLRATTAKEDQPPYRGIEPFGTDDADLFFGRETLTQYLVESLRQHRFLAVLGPSGSGKSSVVRAGLIPALRLGALPGSADWTILVFKPGRTPLTELIVRLLPYLTNPEASLSEQIERLTTAMYGDGWALTTELRQAYPVQILLIIDQFEELFTQTSLEKERQAFLDNLLNASGFKSGKISLVLILRADFYARVANYPDLANRIAVRQAFVSPMLESDLWLAITGPAEQSGLRFEEGLVEEILREMQGQTGALPLLQQALLELWKRREGQSLTFSGYRTIRGVRGAIASWAESVYESLSTTQQSLARRILVELVQPGEATEDTRRRVLQRELRLDPDRAFEIEDVLERLIQNRLLVTDRDALTQEKLVEIAHEALLQEWPRLRDWLEKSRATRVTRSRLRERIKVWERYGRDQGSLLRGVELTEAELWSQENSEDVSPLEKDYLETSRAAQRAELKDKELLQKLLTRQDSTLDALDRRGEAVQNLQSVASIARRTLETPQSREIAPLPDLQIFVRLSSEVGRIRLRFELRAKDPALGLDFKEFGPLSLEMDSRRFAHEMIRHLDHLPLDLDNNAEIAQMRLASIGRSLFRSLPERLQSVLWELQGEVLDVQILSDEPYIPWEVMKLNQRSLTGWKEGPFLCEAFTVTRWVRTIPQHISPLPLRKLALVCPGNPGLPAGLQAAHSEIDDLVTLFGSTRTVATIEPTLIKVLDSLKGGDFDAWHFIGHGGARAEDANSAFLVLDGDQNLMPADLSWAGESLSRRHPLVFLNTSGSGQGGFSLTGPGGWALQFLEAGAGVFIGPLWDITDWSARTFAGSFYKNFLNGVPLGEAVRKARLKVREKFPGNPAWLAYTVYGHPKVVCSPIPSPSKSDLLKLPELEWNPEVSPPGALLRAEYSVVPFHGRETEIADLYDWCHDSSPVRVRLYTGPGGMGKTRLALEIARKLRAEGWSSGLVEPKPGVSAEEAVEGLLRREEKTLAIVDYAETRRELLLPLLRRMHQGNTGTVRLILLARTALDWWEQLKAEGQGVGDLLSRPATTRHSLAPLALSLKERSASYRLASQAFARLLHQEPPAEVTVDLAQPFFERVLLLHMAALADLEGVSTQGRDGILDSLLSSERQEWKSRALAMNLPLSIVPGIGRAMAAITLGGGIEGEREAVEILRRLRVFENQPGEVLLAIARLLHECYPGDRWIEPIMPDLLGEHLVQREMEEGADELLDLVLGSALGPRFV